MKGRRIRFIALILITAQIIAGCQTLAGSAGPATSLIGPRPNILLIITDDQRYDTMDYMPITKARIFDQGATFTRAYATTPLCCPSRASILTGLYAHNHQAFDNYTMPDEDKQTFVQVLHADGYYTGLVGKYLNPWPGEMRPEFDYWAVYAGHGAAQKYFDPKFNINGQEQNLSGYITYLLRDYVLKFLQAAQQQSKPFLLVFTPNAPHYPANPAPGDEKIYADLPPYRPPSFLEEDLSDKPTWVQNFREVTAQGVDDLRRRQLQALHSLDTAIGDMLDALHRQGQDQNTVIMFISDQGVYWGEHGLDGKEFVYEEGPHVPFAIWYPPLISQPRVETRLVANIDIAPTIYELAQLPIPTGLDGRSLVALLQKPDTAWRSWLLMEAWPQPPWRAIHTEQYVYVETPDEVNELYDMIQDPYQMQNRYADPAYAATVKELQGILATIPHTPGPKKITPGE